MTENEKKILLQDIFKAAIAYEKGVADRSLLIVTWDERARRFAAFKAEFPRSGFPHLIGLKAIKTSPEILFSAFINHKASLSSFDATKKSAFVEAKLNLINGAGGYLDFIVNSALYGEFEKSDPDSILYTQTMVGGEDGFMGFVYNKQFEAYVPNTVYTQGIERTTRRGCLPIVAVFAKPKSAKAYNEVLRLDKDARLADVLENLKGVFKFDGDLVKNESPESETKLARPECSPKTKKKRGKAR